MKNFVYGIISVFLLFVCVTFIAAPPVFAIQQNQAQHLARVKRLATQQVNRRIEVIDISMKQIGKYKSKMFESDASFLEGVLVNMRVRLLSWRVRIDKYTDVDALKKDHLANIRDTHIFMVFIPNYKMLLRLFIYKKTQAQIQVRVAKYEVALAQKQNSDKDTRYERVQAELARVKKSMNGLTELTSQTRESINQLTTAFANSNKSDFLNKQRDLQKNIVKIGRQTQAASSSLTQLRTLFEAL